MTTPETTMSAAEVQRPRRYAVLIDPDDGGRRVLVQEHQGQLGFWSWFTDECSGCTDYGDYGSPKYGPTGCRECGFTGKRRVHFFTPLAGLRWRYCGALAEEGGAR